MPGKGKNAPQQKAQQRRGRRAHPQGQQRGRIHKGQARAANTILSNIGNVAKNHALLAQAIALPYTVERRLPYGAEESALMRTTQAFSLRPRVAPVPSTFNESTAYETGSLIVMLIGLPGLSLAYWDTMPFQPEATNLDGGRYSYIVNFASAFTGASNSWVPVPTTSTQVAIEASVGDNGQVVFGDSQAWWPVHNVASSSGYGVWGGFPAWHGSWAPVGVDDGIHYVFLNRGDLLLFNLSYTLTMTTGWTGSFELHTSISVRTYRAMDSDVTDREIQMIYPFTTQTQSGVVQTRYAFFHADQPQWVAVALDSIIANGPIATLTAAKPQMTLSAFGARIFGNVDLASFNGTVTQTMLKNLSDGLATYWPTEGGNGVSGIYGGWRLMRSNMFDTGSGGDPEIGRSVRTVGASMLVTNVTPNMAQGGFIHTARLKGKAFHDYLMKDITSARGYDSSMLAANGVYTFVMPEIPRDEFVETLVNLHFNTFSTRFQLAKLRKIYVHAVVIPPTTPLLATNPTIDDGSAGIAPCAYRITVDEQFEFRTSSRRYRVRPPMDVFTDLQVVMQHFNSNQQWFYENPNHLEKLYAFLKGVTHKAWRGVKTALPYAAPAITAYNPALGPLVAALSALSH